MKMKKITALLTALALTFALTACGSPQNTPASSSQPALSSQQSETPSVYMDIPQEYRSWDENGKNINFERLTTAENGIVAALRYEPAQIGVDIMKKRGECHRCSCGYCLGADCLYAADVWCSWRWIYDIL